MIQSQYKKGGAAIETTGAVCDLSYLFDMMGGKKHLIKGIIDDFLIQIPKELQCLNYAVDRSEYGIIRRYAHALKSTLSIMGMNSSLPLLKEMEEHAAKATNIERVKALNTEFNRICDTAIREIESAKPSFE